MLAVAGRPYLRISGHSDNSKEPQRSQSLHTPHASTMDETLRLMRVAGSKMEERAGWESFSELVLRGTCFEPGAVRQRKRLVLGWETCFWSKLCKLEPTASRPSFASQAAPHFKPKLGIVRKPADSA